MMSFNNENASMQVRSMSQRGMTLIELLLAMALASIVLVATSGLASLIVRSAGQRDTAYTDMRVTERTTALIDAELRQLTQLIDLSPDSVTYETVYAPLSHEPVRYRVRITCVKDAGHWVLRHQSQPIPINPGIQSQPAQSVQAAVSRQMHSGLTECALEAGIRMSDSPSEPVHVQWTRDPNKVAGAAEWWLRVHMATARGVGVPLFLGRVKRGA